MRCCKVLAYFGCAPVMATPQAPETIERCMPCLKAFCKRPAYFDMYDAKKGEEWEKGPSMEVWKETVARDKRRVDWCEIAAAACPAVAGQPTSGSCGKKKSNNNPSTLRPRSQRSF